MSKYKIIAWNVNSIRSLTQKEDLNEFLKKENPHIFCMSETKLSCPDLIVQQNLNNLISGFKYRYYIYFGNFMSFLTLLLCFFTLPLCFFLCFP